MGLQISERGDKLWWSRGNEIPELKDEELSRREFFSLCGKLTGHYPIGGWLRIACSYAKRGCGGERWDDKVGENAMKMMKHILKRVKEHDPVQGQWSVSKNRECTVWTDASSLATGAMICENGNTIEDCGWLRKKDDKSHINLAELEAAIKGINLALKWHFNVINLKVDSATVHGWITSCLNDTHKPRIYGLSELLVKRRLQIIKELRNEYELNISVELVTSANNKADSLTRIPRCIEPINSETVEICSVLKINSNSIRDIHNLHHCGIKKTMFTCQKLGLSPSNEEVKEVVKSCVKCASIDPKPERWEKGTLEVDRVWQRVACDITHYRHKKFLTLIDCGPSRFSIWRQISHEDGTVIARELMNIFLERGPPEELLVDNGKCFYSKEVKSILENFHINIFYRCAHRPEGNSIIERNHRTIKTCAARSEIDPTEAVFWYNALPLSESKQCPSSLFTYEWRIPGEESTIRHEQECKYEIGDMVFVKPHGARCTTTWLQGRITNIFSSTNVEVDGVRRHVRDIRQCPEETINDRVQTVQLPSNFDSDSSESSDEEKDSISDFVIADGDNQLIQDNSENPMEIERSRRIAHPPRWQQDYVLN